MNKFILTPNTSKDPDLEFSGRVLDFIEANGASCQMHLKVDTQTVRQAQCLIVIGGDGTVLQAAGEILGSNVPILGINLGTVGYLAEVERECWQNAILHLLHDDYSVENRMMLCGRLPAPGSTKESRKYAQISGSEQEKADSHSGQNAEQPADPHLCANTVHALNDIVISRTGSMHIADYNVYVNGHFLNRFSADGLIFATPTGSTAYNLSAGGPIIEPGAEMIVMTPICAHTLNNRSIVFADRDVIEVEIAQRRPSQEYLSEVDVDGNQATMLRTGERILIRKSDQRVKLVRLNERSFLETLRRKISG